MQRPIDKHHALIFTMMLLSAAEGDMADAESTTIGRIVRDLPVFRDFDSEQLPVVWRQCSELLYELLAQDDGADTACKMIADALQPRLREIAYLLAFEVAAADRSLAAEVGALEARSDQLRDELESWVLRAAPEARDPDELRGLIRLAGASEAMCDAARDMTWYVERGEALPPVVQMALEETEETSAQTVVQPGSLASGRSLRDLRLEAETGMFVLAVQRGARWIYRPRPRFVLLEGDRLISVGPEDGEEELWALTGMPVAVEG